MVRVQVRLMLAAGFDDPTVVGKVVSMQGKVDSFFDRFGLEVSSGEVEVGQTYPIYGMITKVLDETPGQVLVELNFSIIAHMTIPDHSKIELLKERAFEPGIFVSTVVAKEEAVRVNCQTVVFGKKQQNYV